METSLVGPVEVEPFEDQRSFTDSAGITLARPIPADEHPVLVYLGRLTSPASRATMSQALQTVARILSGGRADALSLEWAALHYQHTARLRAILAERFSAAHTNKLLSAVRGVLRECWRLQLMDAESYHRAVDVANIRAEVLPAGRALQQGEIAALVTACRADRRPAGVRDAAIFGVLYTGGLRRAELVSLDVEELDLSTSAVTVRRGKGRKDRIVYVAEGAARALRDWLAIRGEEPGPLFCPIHRGGRIELRRMSGQAVLHLVKRRAEQAGVRSCGVHDLRRSNVTDLLNAGVDALVVQRLAGHASLTTTLRYDRRGEEAKQKAAAVLHFPYGGAERSANSGNRNSGRIPQITEEARR